MKRVRFMDPTGTIRYGEWNRGQIRFGRREFTLDEINILPPSTPSKVIGVGLNYHDHAAELDLAVPDRPVLFLIGSNSLAGHRSAIPLPNVEDRFEHEAELGIIIGEQCQGVSVEDAKGVIAGFTCVNDISNRTEQFHQSQQDLFRGKAFDNSTPIGPVLAPPNEVPADATIQLRVNGRIRQDSSRKEMIFNVSELVAQISKHLTLESGDIISTGTPSGVGSLQTGDRVEVEIEGIGILEHTIQSP